MNRYESFSRDLPFVRLIIIDSNKVGFCFQCVFVVFAPSNRSLAKTFSFHSSTVKTNDIFTWHSEHIHKRFMLKICITHLALLHHYHHLNVSVLICFHTFAVLLSHHQSSLIIPTFLFFPNKRKKNFSLVPSSFVSFIHYSTDLIGEFFANGFCDAFNMCWKGNHKTTKWCQLVKLSVLCSSQTGYNKLSMQLYVQYI